MNYRVWPNVTFIGASCLHLKLIKHLYSHITQCQLYTVLLLPAPRGSISSQTWTRPGCEPCRRGRGQSWRGCGRRGRRGPRRACTRRGAPTGWCGAAWPSAAWSSLTQITRLLPGLAWQGGLQPGNTQYFCISMVVRRYCKKYFVVQKYFKPDQWRGCI